LSIFKFHDVGSQRASAEQELNSRSPAWVRNTQTLLKLWMTPLFVGVSTGAGEAHHADAVLLGALEDFASRAGTATPHGTPDGLSYRQLRDLNEFYCPLMAI
jgi:hypothetical protein